MFILTFFGFLSNNEYNGIFLITKKINFSLNTPIICSQKFNIKNEGLLSINVYLDSYEVN
jgi:hypothetical protein